MDISGGEEQASMEVGTYIEFQSIYICMLLHKIFRLDNVVAETKVAVDISTCSLFQLAAQ